MGSSISPKKKQLWVFLGWALNPLKSTQIRRTGNVPNKTVGLWVYRVEEFRAQGFV